MDSKPLFRSLSEIRMRGGTGAKPLLGAALTPTGCSAKYRGTARSLRSARAKSRARSTSQYHSDMVLAVGVVVVPIECQTKTMHKITFVNRLLKVANDPVIQRTGPDRLIGIGGNEDRWDRMSQLDETLVEIYARHRRHIDIRDQAICFHEMR